MTVEEMRKRKRELGYTNHRLAQESGVPLGTLQKIFGGETKAPRRETIEALEQILGQERGRGWNLGMKNKNLAAREPGRNESGHVLREAAPVYQSRTKRQGEYTKEESSPSTKCCLRESFRSQSAEASASPAFACCFWQRPMWARFRFPSGMRKP